MSATDIRALRLPHAKAFGRGYDCAVVDQVIAQCASSVELLTLRLVATRSELMRVRTELAELQSEVASDHAVQLLKTARATADAIVTKAMEDREREAEITRQLAEEALAAAAAQRRGEERKARELVEEATRRAAVIQAQAGERLDRLTVATELAEQTIEREARQLQTFRDTAKTQIEEFIDGMIDHVAEQYGRAHPLAAQAAAAAARRSPTSAPGSGRPPAGGRGRRAPRVAGRSSVPAEKWADATLGFTGAIPRPGSFPAVQLPRQFVRAEHQ